VFRLFRVYRVLSFSYMKVLIIRLGAIGDVVHTLPALAALRRAMPEAHLAWVVERGGSSALLKGNHYLDDLIELDLRGWRKNLARPETARAIRDAVAHLRSARFDLALDFQGLLKSAMVPWIARVPRRVGFKREALREPASSLLLTEEVEADDEDHIIKKNLQLVAHLGCEVKGEYEFPVSLSPHDDRFADEQLARFDGEFAILNPGGGWPTKLWGTEGIAAIADRLWELCGIRSAVTYGPGEEELARSVIDRSRTGAAVALASTLKQFFALAQRASVFIGGDTGPMHLAAAAGAPIVSIFGPTSSRRNGPFAEDDVVIERFDLDCRTDCYRRSCSHTSCMNIPVEMVWQGVIKRLRIAARSSQSGLRAGNRRAQVLSGTG
jgi:lipopolysaccharide heptosyltransferase I